MRERPLFAPRAVCVWLTFIALSFLLLESAFATGFFINQQSVKGRGRVDAGNTAGADDLGTIFFNPAGLIQLRRSTELAKDPGSKEPTDWRFSVGAQLVIPRSDQDNAGSAAASPGTLGAFVPYAGGNSRNPTDPTPIANVYVAKWLPDGSAAFGFGANIPFGLRAEFDPAWYGRYDAIEASLRTYNFSVVAALKIDTNLSIGGGINLQYARTTLTSAVPDPLNPGGPTVATDAHVATVGRDWSPGFNFGALYSFDSVGRTRVGAHYRSGMKHDISGSSTFSGFTGFFAGFNGRVGADAELRLPAIATVGFWHNLTDDLALLGEFEWYDWSKFDTVRIRFSDGRPDAVRPTKYRDSFGVAVGAEYRVSDHLTTRGGLKFDRTPTTDAFRDTTVPDADRFWLGLGATYRHSRRLRADLAFNHVFFRDTTVALTRNFFEGTPVATAVRINGRVKNVVNTFALDVRYAY